MSVTVPTDGLAPPLVPLYTVDGQPVGAVRARLSGAMISRFTCQQLKDDQYAPLDAMGFTLRGPGDCARGRRWRRRSQRGAYATVRRPPQLVDQCDALRPDCSTSSFRRSRRSLLAERHLSSSTSFRVGTTW